MTESWNLNLHCKTQFPVYVVWHIVENISQFMFASQIILHKTCHVQRISYAKKSFYHIIGLLSSLEIINDYIFISVNREYVSVQTLKIYSYIFLDL